MKKSIKKILVFVATILIILFSSAIFVKYNTAANNYVALSLFHYEHDNPVSWLGVSITYGDHLVYSIDESKQTIYFFRPRMQDQGSFAITKNDRKLVELEKTVENFKQTSSYEYISEKNIFIDGHQAIEVFARSKKMKGQYLHGFFIKDTDFIVDYIGPKENYTYFSDLVHNITFVQQ